MGAGGGNLSVEPEAAPVQPQWPQTRLAMRRTSPRLHAFTLIEMLVVIAIIAILIGLAFPVFQSVQNSAKRTQAKNDITQLVTAVNAFYTEYGRYPLTPATSADTTYSAGSTNKLLNELRNVGAAENARGITFITPPDAKDENKPRSGIASKDVTVSGIAIKGGELVDPWGTPYNVRVDTDYDNFVDNPYSSNAGTAKNPAGTLAVQAGVIVWSLGKNQAGGSGDKNLGDNKDDVISWQ